MEIVLLILIVKEAFGAIGFGSGGKLGGDRVSDWAGNKMSGLGDRLFGGLNRTENEQEQVDNLLSYDRRLDNYSRGLENVTFTEAKQFTSDIDAILVLVNQTIETEREVEMIAQQVRSGQLHADVSAKVQGLRNKYKQDVELILKKLSAAFKLLRDERGKFHKEVQLMLTTEKEDKRIKSLSGQIVKIMGQNGKTIDILVKDHALNPQVAQEGYRLSGEVKKLESIDVERDTFAKNYVAKLNLLLSQSLTEVKEIDKLELNINDLSKRGMLRGQQLQDLKGWLLQLRNFELRKEKEIVGEEQILNNIRNLDNYLGKLGREVVAFAETLKKQDLKNAEYLKLHEGLNASVGSIQKDLKI